MSAQSRQSPGFCGAFLQSTPGVRRKMSGVGLSRAAYGDAWRTRRRVHDVPVAELDTKRAANTPLSAATPCRSGDQGGMVGLSGVRGVS